MSWITYCSGLMDQSSSDPAVAPSNYCPQRQIDWTKAQNPYSLKSIRDPARLKGRRDKLDILRRSWDSMDSYCITGQREQGKSSVARVCQLELHTNEQFVAIYLQWGDLGTDELPAICHNICYEIAEWLRKKYGTKELVPPKMEAFLGNEGFVYCFFLRTTTQAFKGLSAIYLS